MKNLISVFAIALLPATLHSVLACECFANDEENEPECEYGARPTIEECLADDKCHWGPGEN